MNMFTAARENIEKTKTQISAMAKYPQEFLKYNTVRNIGAMQRCMYASEACAGCVDSITINFMTNW